MNGTQHVYLLNFCHSLAIVLIVSPTRYHVSDEVAFPMLLRGLTRENTWTDLTRAEMPVAREKQTIEKPEVSDSF
jgi:hypothetical protein